MKIAIISDIHANLEALKSTLEDIKKRKVDKIICLGDIIAKGVHPKECIELIKENCDIVLRGNCDRYFSEEHNDINELSEEEVKRINWNQSMLNDEERKYLLNLPFSYEFYMSGSLVRLFHATPEKDNIVIINNDEIQTKLKMFYPSNNTMSQKNADVVIYGHIHHQYMDKIYNKTIINVGSVGNSFDVIRNPLKDSNVMETTKSNYLIIEGEYDSKKYSSDISFQFIKVPYDIDKELSSDKLNIEKENYMYELKQGRYRNMTKIYNNFKRLNVDVENI
ncbi:MAG: metallophosphoesterase family protein [Clostridia bacterium]|jgi:protein phosphatase|nr:ser/Thr phosphatase family protein [Clostridium sp. CAG:571]HJJ06965.1 metallophosphatase family protein [Clostridiaceae bacterium]HJJ13524.1 metallophosphatase family protein [Clostridiaceae bacterium]